MPTGHQAMHRPQPTHPDSPNWSCQVPSLWVSHCRYRLRVDVRTGPPCRYEKSRSKQESQRSQRSACSPATSVTSSTVVQKQVGQTIVQLPQDRQRAATSSQRAASWLPASRSRRSPSGSARLIFVAAAATAAAASSTRSTGAGSVGSCVSNSSPAGVPTSTGPGAARGTR